VVTTFITTLFVTKGRVCTHIYCLSPSLDIMLILKIPTEYYNWCIKFCRYGGRGLSSTDSSQFPKWKRNNSPITVSLRLLSYLWDLKTWSIVPPWELILFRCSLSVLSQQYVLLFQ
jgi:hypothetical protein